jgi:transposase InsO family protein
LRALFADWGLPGALRVDNGAPWGSPRDPPPDLALWAIGLGVAVRHNRPRRCQENGVVERSHGVLGAWAEPAACADAAALQTALTAASRYQREAYPAIGGASRATAFPALMAGGRPFDPAREAAAFDERRVWTYLAGKRWRRRVDKAGQISVYHRALGVGKRWKGQEVALQFDAEAVAWVVRDDRGAELVRHPAAELSRARILALDVSRKR